MGAGIYLGHPRHINSVSTRAASLRGSSRLLFRALHILEAETGCCPGALAREIQVWIHSCSHSRLGTVAGESGWPEPAKNLLHFSAGSDKCPDWIPWTEPAPWEECHKNPKILLCCKVTPLGAATAGSSCCSHTSQQHPALLEATNPGIPTFQQWLTHLYIC